MSAAIAAPEARAETQPGSAEPPRARQWMWAGLVLALIGLPFLSQPGRYIPDTRDALWFDPTTYLGQSLTLWHASPYLGGQNRDALMVPMGVVVWLLHSVGLPVWAVERLWHGLLLFAAAGGTVLLVDRLRGRRTVLVPLTAGLLYTLTPYVYGFGLGTTDAFLAYVLLPLLLWAVHRGLSRPGLRSAAVFGLVAFLMGGGNGATQIYAMAATVLFGLWLVFVERLATPRDALRFGLLAALFTAGLNAYWLLLLPTKEVANELAFGEQPPLVNMASSWSESIRGVGLWIYYGGDQFGPWMPQVRRFISSPPFVVAGFLVPIGAFLTAWLSRWRLRWFFFGLAVLAVLVMSGVFPVDAPTPFGHLLFSLYRRAPASVGLRTTYAFASALNLSLAILAAMGLGGALRWSRGRVTLPGGLRGWHVAVAVPAVLAVVLNGYPLWGGRLYDHGHSAAPIPGYWKQALAFLERGNGSGRTFFAPGTLFSYYRWGELHEGIAEATPSLATVHRTGIPVQDRYGSDLLAAIEQPYGLHLPAAGSAALLRELGVDRVVLQNDIDWQRTHTERPADIQALVRDPTFEPLTTFGVAGENTTGPTSPLASDLGTVKAERRLPPVEVYALKDAPPVVRTEPDAPVVVSGDGFGLAAMAQLGMLGGRPILYSGALTPSDLTRLVKVEHAGFVVTDSNRRRVWSFGDLIGNFSETLPLGRPGPGTKVGFELFGGRPSTQSIAVYEGVKDVRASGYGTVLSKQPEYRPANAFDGDPSSWWVVGGLGNPVGQWVEVSLRSPLRMSSIALDEPKPLYGRSVSSARLEFSDGTSVLTRTRPGANVVNFAPRTSSSLRVVITGVRRGKPGLLNPVGFTDVRIPSLHMHEAIRVPTDLFGLARATPTGLFTLEGAPLTYVFHRQRTGVILDRDEEATLDRRFFVPYNSPFALAGTAHLNSSANDQAIDALALGPRPVTVSSSSRLDGFPALRGSSAFDGDPSTAWVPQRDVGEWLRIAFPNRRIGQVVLHSQLGPFRTLILKARLSFSDGTSVTAGAKDFLSGDVTFSFRPRDTSSVKIEILQVVTLPNQTPPPVGISEVEIPGVAPLRFDPLAPLPCHTDPAFTLDGVPTPVRADGDVAQLLAGKELPVAPCGGSALDLTSGWHELDAGGALLPDDLALHTGPPAATPPSAPGTRVTTVPGGGYDVDVRGASAPFYLVIGQNVDPGWGATIDGASLGPPVLLDGYSAGWRVDRSGSYRIEVRYGPQRWYTAGLAASGAFALVAAAIVAWPLVRRRRR